MPTYMPDILGATAGLGILWWVRLRRPCLLLLHSDRQGSSIHRNVSPDEKLLRKRSSTLKKVRDSSAGGLFSCIVLCIITTSAGNGGVLEKSAGGSYGDQYPMHDIFSNDPRNVALLTPRVFLPPRSVTKQLRLYDTLTLVCRPSELRGEESAASNGAEERAHEADASAKPLSRVDQDTQRANNVRQPVSACWLRRRACVPLVGHLVKSVAQTGIFVTILPTHDYVLRRLRTCTLTTFLDTCNLCSFLVSYVMAAITNTNQVRARTPFGPSFLTPAGGSPPVLIRASGRRPCRFRCLGAAA